jgi:hypothetical protein
MRGALHVPVTAVTGGGSDPHILVFQTSFLVPFFRFFLFSFALRFFS